MPPGADGLDSVHFQNLLDWTPIRQAGYPWASIYIGGIYGTTKASIEAAWRAGVVLMPNFERSPDAAKGGALVGQIHAGTAVQQLQVLGFRGESPVVFSGSDTGFTVAELPAALDYHHALVDVLGPIGWTGGAYGLKRVMELLPLQSWWPPDWPIWHWGGDGYAMYSWAWAKQWYGHKPKGMPEPFHVEHDLSDIPFAVDENTLMRSMRFWSGYGDDKVDPIPLEDDMPKIITNAEPYPQWEEPAAIGDIPPDGANWPIGWVRWMMMPNGDPGNPRGGSKRWLQGAEYAAYSMDAATPLTTGQIQSIPGYNPPAPQAATVDIDAVAEAVRQKFRTEPLS